MARRNTGLTTWFKENWVDLSRPKKGGGFMSCGRKSATGKKGAMSAKRQKTLREDGGQRHSAAGSLQQCH